MSDKTLPSPTAAVFLLIVLSGFLLFILSIPEVDRQELIRDRNSISEEINLLSLENIDIDGYDGYRRTNINYDSFNLNFDSEKVFYNQAKSVKLEANLINSKSYEFNFNPIYNSDYLFSSVEFVIGDISSYGKIRLYLNDELISEVSPIKDQKFKIDLDKKNQVNGNNIIKIKPSYQGLNPFNKFELEIIDLDYVENYEGRSDSYKNSFYVNEGNTISELNLNYLLRSSSYNPKYSLYLNNNLVTNSVLGNEISINLPTEYVKEGINIIEYKLISNSDLDFILPKLQIRSERQFKSDFYTFEIDDRLARLIINNRVDCKLFSSSNVEYSVLLNNFNLEIKDYTSYQKDICKNLVFGENKLQIISDKDVNIDYLEIALI